MSPVPADDIHKRIKEAKLPYFESDHFSGGGSRIHGELLKVGIDVERWAPGENSTSQSPPSSSLAS